MKNQTPEAIINDKDTVAVTADLSPQEMISIAGEIATFVKNKASETGKRISGRELENIMVITGLMLPAGNELVG
ncbi:hypothetical protein GTGU_04099 [Trabulsiella guamensis ATCC 49490]|uniref:Uncharacterized protein n=1 Tax=Trabulsiella guamensis ATCC 49490 TaxID=1005994 RepID=A0A084ZQB6_9ENTR|nr:hypothetical protein [Trabulsiella guamensis]KFB99660.1 hypothetical protein GTGU_04099 [Trabulsiella guamensis ATCC 49490]